MSVAQIHFNPLSGTNLFRQVGAVLFLFWLNILKATGLSLKEKGKGGGG